MRLPQIQITTNDLKMNYEIQDATQKIRQPKAEQTIEQPAATLEINTTNGKLSIDSSQARRDIGMIGPLESTKNFAQKGTQVNLEGIAKRVREGRQMMLGAGKGQGRATIQNIAKQNHGPKRPGPYNIKFVPSIGSVKIDYTPGTTNIDIEANSPKIDTKVNKPIHDYTGGKVTGTMVQRPTISIDVLK
ncbi:DUF6470 family protein [Solibacillus sp. FSL H8-0538]|uniref:DUF6470 family protein n=1 Tax=Solibacillus sp. FSL H8-0538 TaxID=2921400 RepID=UPI0030F62A14